MQHIISKLRGILRGPWVIGGVVLAAVIIGGVYSFGGGPKAEFIKVERGTISQEVSATGKVSSAEELSLAFDRSGRIIRVNKNVGDRVRAGETIATLSSGDLAARLASAEASVTAAEARLDELKRGARPEELAIKETALAEAKLGLARSYSSTFTTLENAYINADDSVRKQTDAFFNQDEELNPSLSFQTYDLQAEIDSKNGRASMTKELAAWKSELALLSPGSAPSDLDAGLAKGEAHLLKVQGFLKRVGDALIRQANLTPSEVTSYQTSLTTARTQVSAAISNITSARQSIAAGAIAVEQADNNLKLARAGSSSESIRVQEAQVASAKANVMDIESELAKTVIRAPINGIITRQDAKPGQTATMQSPLVGMISDAKFEIEANVPEIDIGRVKEGNPTTATFDAFPDEKFEGVVASIDPAETVVDGVVNFKVKIALLKDDPRIKSGFTANMDIKTMSRENVLLLPQYALVREGDATYARKMVDGKEVRVRVETGMRGRGGLVEIISGLSEGEEVVNVSTASD